MRNAPYGLRRKKMETGRKNLERGERKMGGKKRSIMFAYLEEEGMGPREGEIPENEVNVAFRHINSANVLGGNGWERKGIL